jgi:hypothetical protein
LSDGRQAKMGDAAASHASVRSMFIRF